MPPGSRVYLDVSALCRPFDEQVQLRIQLETDAVLLILAHVATGDTQMAMSSALWYEVSANPVNAKREPILELLDLYGEYLDNGSGSIQNRWQALIDKGVTDMDALHVATAEEHGYDFVTCDDRLLRKIAKLGLSIWCGTPVAFCEREELR